MKFIKTGYSKINNSHKIGRKLLEAELAETNWQTTSARSRKDQNGGTLPMPYATLPGHLAQKGTLLMRNLNSKLYCGH